MNSIPRILDIPEAELKQFDELIHDYRAKHIRSSQAILDKVLQNQPEHIKNIKNKKVSKTIQILRETVWQDYLKDEIEFNALLMKDLHQKLKTPKAILDALIAQKALEKTNSQVLLAKIQALCGEYAGRVFPYIYRLSLSNTQSRRSRAGKTFEAIIYKIYEALGYAFESQSQVGRKIFAEAGYRSKTIINIFKNEQNDWEDLFNYVNHYHPIIYVHTTLREINEELLKNLSKSSLMVITDTLNLKNPHPQILNYEDYFFTEIPYVLHYWKH